MTWFTGLLVKEKTKSYWSLFPIIAGHMAWPAMIGNQLALPRSPPSTSCYCGSCRHQETWHNWKISTTSTSSSIEIHRSTNRLAEGRAAQSSNIERSTVALKASCVTPSGADGVTISWGSDYLSPWILFRWEVNSRIFTLVLQPFCMYKPWLPWSNNKLMFTSLTSWNAWSIVKGLFDHGRFFWSSLPMDRLHPNVLSFQPQVRSLRSRRPAATLKRGD